MQQTIQGESIVFYILFTGLIIMNTALEYELWTAQKLVLGWRMAKSMSVYYCIHVFSFVVFQSIVVLVNISTLQYYWDHL